LLVPMDEAEFTSKSWALMAIRAHLESWAKTASHSVGPKRSSDVSLTEVKTTSG
jgi:hypothetical protein